jgi:hypothetical protein
LTGNSDDAAELLDRLADDPALPEARQYLSSKADILRQIDQTHRFYPVLRYFHYREPHYALPRILLTTLASATLLRGALAPQCYTHLIHSPALDELFEAAILL